MCVPLIAEARMRGVLYMEGTPSPSGFDSGDMRFLRIVAGHAVIGLRLARRIESLTDERDILKEENQTDGGVLGRSAAMQRVFELAREAAAALERDLSTRNIDGIELRALPGLAPKCWTYHF